MTEFMALNQALDDDKYVQTIKTENVNCDKHGSYLQSTLLLKMSNKQIMTECPICVVIRRVEEAQQFLTQGERDYKATQIQKLFNRSGIPPKFTGRSLDNFIQTPDNAVNLDKVKEFCLSLKNNLFCGHGLIFFGPKGTGKTHLSCAIAEIAIKQQMSALFITAGDIADDVKEAFNGKQSEKSKIQKYTVPDLLIIDEILAGAGEFETKTIAKILNTRYSQKRSTIIITNLDLLPPKDNPSTITLASVIGERIMDRLRETNKAIRFAGKSFRDRTNYLTKE